MKRTFSHYELEKELGRGGMATVYQARDLVTGRPVALKMLLDHLSSEEITRRRFLREARAGMALSHSAIVKVYEVGEENKQPFIAMELVEGKRLDEIMLDETFGPERAINLGIKIADALMAAHKKGIIHRDIKPNNIMVSNDAPKIMDFGLARIAEASTLTEKDEIVGTLYYMSPEQAMGAPIDARSDIFSLGVVLYQLLTNVLPFEGNHPGAIIHSILHSDPLRIEELRKGIAVEVEQVVFKALQKQPKNRYQSAGELKSDLERLREILKGSALELIASEEAFGEEARGIYSSLVGRRREMQVLESHLAQMLRGEGSTVLVSGEAGIGKSRLVWELGRKAKKEKSRYLIGRCLYGEEGFPYHPILEVIHSYLRLKVVRDPRGIRDLIEKKAPHLIQRLEIIQSFLLMKGDKDTQLISKEQLWDTAMELVRMMSQDRPTVIHFEDLQWTDLPTLHLLSHLSRNLRGERVLLVGTYRPEELIDELKPHPLILVLKKMKKEELYREICLDRLDRQQTQDVIRSVFTESDLPQSFGELIYKETEGNPLFILETLKMLQDEQVIYLEDGRWNLTRSVGRISIPDRVNDVIADRLRSLNPEERSLVDAASVQGDSFQSDPLCYCLGLPRMVVLRGLQTLERRHHLIHSSENEYHFGHGKIRTVIYDSLIPELRREYHRHLGEYLISNFGEAAEYAGKIVRHLLEAHQEERVLPYLVKAGEHAKRLFANEEAIQYFDKGTELVSKQLKERPSTSLQRKRLDLLKARAEVRNLIGHYEDAAADYRKTMALSKALRDRKEEAYGLNGLGITLRRKGDYHWALTCFQRALGIQREIGDRRGEGNALNNIGLIHRHLGDYERSLDYYSQALQAARRLRNEYGEGTTLHNIAIIHDSRGDYEAGLSCHAQALEIQRRIGDREGEGYTLGSMGLVHTCRGDYENGLSCLEEALKISGQIGDKRNSGVLFSNIGLLHRYRADYSLALKYYMQSLEVHQEIGNREGQWEAFRHLCRLHLDVGELQKALEMFEEARKMSLELGVGGRRAWFLIDEGMMEFTRGNLKTAHLRSDEGVGIAREMNDIDATIEGLLVAARIEIRRREESKAGDTAGEALKLASEKARIPDVAQAHLLLSHIGLLALDLGRAESHGREAIRIAQKSGLRELLWQAHSGLGRVFLKKKQRSLAKIQLEEAEKVMSTIASKLDEKLRKIYLSKKEIKELRRDVRNIKKVTGRTKKS